MHRRKSTPHFLPWNLLMPVTGPAAFWGETAPAKGPVSPRKDGKVPVLMPLSLRDLQQFHHLWSTCFSIFLFLCKHKQPIVKLSLETSKCCQEESTFASRKLGDSSLCSFYSCKEWSQIPPWLGWSQLAAILLWISPTQMPTDVSQTELRNVLIDTGPPYIKGVEVQVV